MLKILFCLLLGLMTGCTTMQYTHGVPNLNQVDDNVYRGGQPTQQGWDYLIKMGIKVDLKLNTKHEASDDYAAQRGVLVIYEPINLVQQTIGEPDFLQLQTNLVVLNYCYLNNVKVYVHCSHGQDRTGLVIGSYRCYIDDWPKDKAYQEMEQIGFHPMLRGLYWAWEDYVR